MKEKHARSVLASHLREVVGIVSKTDILFKVMSQGRNPRQDQAKGNNDEPCSR